MIVIAPNGSEISSKKIQKTLYYDVVGDGIAYKFR